MNDLNIAITGANGYIGSYLVNAFRSKKFHVYEMIRKSNQSNASIIPFKLGLTDCIQRLKKIDVLIHCAHDFNLKNFKKNKKINVEGSLQLFEEATIAGVKKIIFLSSTSSFKNTISDYGRIKYQIEQEGRKYKIINIRCGLVFGVPLAGLLKSMAAMVKILRIIPIVGDGNQAFFPCHIHDLYSFIEKIILSDLQCSEPFIAASDQQVSFKEILLLLASLKNKKINFLQLPFPFIYSTLRLIEIFAPKLKLRSDSLKYLKMSSQEINFSENLKLGNRFRPLNKETLRSEYKFP